MLNIKGAFVVIKQSGVEPVILGERQYVGYMERVTIVGFDKANHFVFGAGTIAALPCTQACMESVALNYADTEKHGKMVKAICARIALGMPLGNGKDIGEGGLGIKSPVDAPKSPNGGSRVSVPDSINA
jgi:hypothetical protein